MTDRQNSAKSQEEFIPTLYYYEHCPYCIRVLTTAGLAKITLDTVVLANDDAETPTQMIGAKMVPILETQPQHYMGESLDIVHYLADTYHYVIERNEELNQKVTDFLASQRLSVHSLMMARCVKLPLAEFREQSAIDYFVHKKTPIIGDFDVALQHSSDFISALSQSMKDVTALFEELTENLSSEAAIMLFSSLYGIFYVKDFPWPAAAQKFMQTMGDAAQLPVFGDVCTPL